MGIYKLVECGMPATSMVDQFCSVSTVSVGQVGPSVRISASAELWVACYILEVSASDEFLQRLLELFFHLIQNRSSSLKKKLKGLKKKLKDRMTDFQMIDLLIETGNSEQIFHKAIQEMGRGQLHDPSNQVKLLL
ncbi:putative syntaxin-131 isoform X2 [Magnolia sinica]|uniref:putative syntaxin-131 isoform X2 n=1 Tax=Magnolia sinica TaxID=86752 RepID=UPI002657B35B|nr:putative syntaxin-131 isoform X2 [Magnolia sinica]